MKPLILLLVLLAPSASPARLFYHGNAGKRQIALTFDAGADRGYAGAILSTLERLHLHATFGMTGRWARANPDLVRRMARDKDEFINHTYDHRSFTGVSTQSGPLTRAQRIWEIEQADRAIRSLTGHSSKPYFRPPYGDLDAGTLTLVRSLGYRDVVMWTVDTLGWEHLSAPQIVRRSLTLAVPGAIFLMHVGSQSQDSVALPRVIELLKKRGYRFVTISLLLGHH
ncbi:MAG: polysaccharide deacetylase family protein [Chloroflexota bacterium]